ncbi:hypothetical protein BGX28_009049 [Mortierella sp. GBA30]|nr:hypothetical protein BGX28_009049 [Mortierella sp. GBA30]
MAKPSSHWSTHDALNSSAPVVQDIVSYHSPSIFDDIQSDNNEAYIIWNNPPGSVLHAPGSHNTQSCQPSAPTTSGLIDAQTSKKTRDGYSFKHCSAEGSDNHTEQQEQDLSTNSVYKTAPPGQNPNSAHRSHITDVQPAAATSTPANDQIIMAATPEKLVQKLTSEINYTFLTDFFLIYRLFITPVALLKLIMLRFNWALIDNSPERQIVRIRTFVTLRHWLLNYFGFDFMRSKDLHNMLGVFLRSLARNPLVASSPRDQRIARELMRYAQSLKKLHYRNKAQQKLERQTHRRRGNPHRPHSTSVAERSSIDANGACLHSPVPSCQSSVASGSQKRSSIVSESITEELAVYFRSSDQYDEGCSTEDEDFSQLDDTDLSSDDSSSVSRDHSVNASESDMHDDGLDSGSESLESRESECAQESAAPLGSGSLRSQYFTQSIVSSTASREPFKRVDSALPDLHAGAGGTHRDNLDTLSQGHRSSISDKQNRAKRYSRPHSSRGSTAPPIAHGPPLSARSSSKSIKPYMNPPPRSIDTSEKKKSWSKYMSVTVNRLSRMKRVFSSNSSKSGRHIHSSSSIPSMDNASRRGALSTTSRTRSARRWQGNRSDPEGEKISRYLLGSCTGMSVLLSSSDVRRLSIDHKYVAERDQQRDDAGSDWSSDDDYSQYEMTRRSSRQMTGSLDHPQEDQNEVPLDLRPDEAGWSPVCCMSYAPTTPLDGALSDEEARYTIEDNDQRSGPISDCGGERHPSSPPILDSHRVSTGGDKHKVATRVDQAVHESMTEGRAAATAALSNVIKRPAPTLRRTQRIEQDHRESWVTFSSADSSVFGTVLNGNHPPPSQSIQERGVRANVDRFIERIYKAQQQQQQQQKQQEYQSSTQFWDQRVKQHQVKSVRRHSSSLRYLEGWHAYPLCAEQASVPTSPAISASAERCTTLAPESKPTPSTFHTQHHSQILSATRPRPSLGLRSHSQPHQTNSKSDTEMNSLSVKAPPLLLPGRSARALDQYRHDGLDHQDGAEGPIVGTSSTSPSLKSRENYIRPDTFLHVRQSQFQRRATEPQLFRGPRTSAFAVKEPQAPSIVLRYRSEMIAQQLCLIERDLLTKVQWYELVDAGWTKKSSQDCTTPIATTSTKAVVLHGSASEQGVAEADVAVSFITEQKAKTTSIPVAGPMNIQQNTRNSEAGDSPGIKRLVERFNLTCQWVTSEIVCTRDLEMRVKVVEKFIRIAQTCYNHSNFSSLMQLMLGLQAHSVSRLSQTWARVRSQEMSIMHDLVEFTSPFHNWKHLRDAMKNIADEWGGSSKGAGSDSGTVNGAGISAFARAKKSMSSRSGQTIFFNKRSRASEGKRFSQQLDSAPSGFPSASQERDSEKNDTERLQLRGCIPFLGLYLSDLVFNSELPSYIEHNKEEATDEVPERDNFLPRSPLVNIHKHRTTATIIRRVLTFRTIAGRYPFQPSPDVYAQLMSIHGLSPAEISKLSSLCEERAT